MEELTPFCTAASSFAHTVQPLGEVLLPLNDVGLKTKGNRRRTQHGRSHTSTDCVALRRRRWCLGAALTRVCCGSLASVRSPKPACPHRVSASSPTSLHCSFSGPSRPKPTCSEEFTPFCAAVLSNGALPTPSALSVQCFYLSVT